jgi:hypothetical protein
MKKTTRFLLAGAFLLLTTATVLHGCGAKEGAAPAPAKFTIVGSGS